MTLAGRRWGPLVGGWLGGLPVVVGPILVVLTVDHDEAFVADAAAGALLGLLAIPAFALAYAGASRVTGWAPALAAGWVAAALTTAVINSAEPPPALALLVVGVSLAATAALIRRPTHARPPSASGSGLLVRCGLTAGVVLAATELAGVLGPRLGGAIASLPVLASMLAAFTHAQEGADAARSLLRGMLGGLLSYAIFCFSVAVLLEPGATTAAFLIAAAAAFGVHSVVLADALWLTTPRRTGRPRRPASASRREPPGSAAAESAAPSR